MVKHPEVIYFIRDKEKVEDNLESLKNTLDECVDAGMLDPGAEFHNELLALMDEVDLAKTYLELNEVIEKAKTLEDDVDAWLALKGRTTLSLEWPRHIENS
jgi:uncharacterized protein YoxC